MTRRTRLGLTALACIVVAIVAFDVRAWFGAVPTDAPEPQQSSASEASVPEVRRGLDKTPLVYPAQFVDQLVQRSRDAFVLVQDAAAPGETVAGVVVSPTEVLIATPRGANRWLMSTGDGQLRPLTRRAADPVNGLSLLTTDEPLVSFVPFGPAALTPGSPVVAVRPMPQALVTQLIPAPGTEASLAARLAGSLLPAGTSVIDLDGRVVAFFGAGVTGGIPILGNELDGVILPSLRKAAAPALPWVGADLQAMDPTLEPVFGEGVAVVVWVDPGSPADTAGLQARDVVVGMRIDDKPVPTVEALDASLQPGTSLALRVRRRTRTREVAIDVGRLRYPRDVDGGIGVAVDGAAPSLRVAPASPLASAGLRTGDVVEAANGTSVTAADLERILRRNREVVLTVRRGGERRFVVLPEAAEPASRPAS